MKKLIVLPALLLFVAASPNKMEPLKQQGKYYNSPVNTKLDSLNISTKELQHLIKKI